MLLLFIVLGIKLFIHHLMFVLVCGKCGPSLSFCTQWNFPGHSNFSKPNEYMWPIPPLFVYLLHFFVGP
ncbi:hypothetical protein EUGRSUZ_C03107 [Eucalyptus grandis]|uniref:Uncharacterized protein n=2 Tax=Eucalyptus grandis TaxID=71139 RepID=A0A059CTN4_EUCGR|nr:hypothetical protein EUGRSUZ_C03107 [Eucalyptus grandis]